MRACFHALNEQERVVFRRELVDMLKEYEKENVRPELRRILEGVKSNDPYTVLKRKHKKRLDK